ncbi:bacteriocin [Lactococcus sp.]|uniref:bacteriocin n=1 Tax=Lactococcus sp. TaxID=44273 RepID=UPI0035B425EC
MSENEFDKFEKMTDEELMNVKGGYIVIPNWPGETVIPWWWSTKPAANVDAFAGSVLTLY